MSFDRVVNVNNKISNIETYLNNKSVALVSPKTSPGISGFIFDIPQRENVTLSAEISDNFTEDNSFINDHRVIKPVKITLTGLVGELVVTQEVSDLILNTLQSGLSTVNAYLGDYTDGMTQKLEEVVNQSITAISKVNQVVDRVKNIVEGFNGEGAYNNSQQRAFSNLEALFKSETVLTVQTPWKYYGSMMIETIDFTQNEDNEDLSEISVTLKEMRFATIGISSYKNDLDASRNELQSNDERDTGQIKGQRNSFLFDSTTALTGGF